MKFLIRESNLDRVVGMYLTTKFNGWGKFKSSVFPVGIFYVTENGDIMAEVIKKNNFVGVILDYSVWTSIADMFQFETIKEESDSISEWAKTYFNVEDSAVDIRDFVETIDDL